jgi:hypothetical protein
MKKNSVSFWGKTRFLTAIFFLLFSFFNILLIFGCENDDTGPNEAVNPDANNPIIINKSAKTVKIYTEINSYYFTNSSWHCSAYKETDNGKKCLFSSYAKPLDLYDALVSIGAEPGNNMELGGPDTMYVEGSVLELSVEWEGSAKSYTLDQVINDAGGNGVEIRFGGNRATQESLNTGCLTCWVSCAAGITSNAKNCAKDFSSGKVNITGLSDVLPENGKGVIMTYKLK